MKKWKVSQKVELADLASVELRGAPSILKDAPNYFLVLQNFKLGAVVLPRKEINFKP